MMDYIFIVNSKSHKKRAFPIISGTPSSFYLSKTYIRSLFFYREFVDTATCIFLARTKYNRREL